MTNREREILEIIKKQPDIEQSEIASRLNIARASVAVHISNLQKKGYISGRIYLVNDFDYAVGIGAANVDICGRSKNPIIMADSNPGAMSISLGGVTRNICENLARLGGSVKLISALGSDLYGHMIREESTAAGIDMSQCMTVEGHPSSTYMSLLDERGEMRSSTEWAGALSSAMVSGRDIVYVIGGPFGFSKGVYDRADAMLSLSRLTFSHQMVRAIFAEGLYRAFTIIHNEKYHHE